jgi:hypothetical protein
MAMTVGLLLGKKYCPACGENQFNDLFDVRKIGKCKAGHYRAPGGILPGSVPAWPWTILSSPIDQQCHSRSINYVFPIDQQCHPQSINTVIPAKAGIYE